MTRLSLCRRVLTVVLALSAAAAQACPFCSAVSMTLSEEIKNADAAVIAKLVKLPVAPKEAAEDGAVTTAEVSRATFEIVTVLKGPDSVKPNQKIDVLYFGTNPLGTEFLIIGTDPKDLAWGSPLPLSERSQKYVSKLVKLPESGKERLLFFQDYLEDKDSLLASDSYDEFAKAPYPEVSQIKDNMVHDKLVAWIKDPNTATSRRRLYLTMLGVCGGKDDLPVLESMIKTEDRQMRAALDALIACYLNLTHGEGMPLVEDLFLKNTKAEYTDTYAAIMALRFHGQETNIVPKQRLMQGLRYMLDRPQLADLVIPDLARWQDWSVMDRLVKLFKDADDDSVWVRVPVINYLRACPLPIAKEHIEELRKIDPEAVKRASQFFPIAAGSPPPGSQRPKADDAGGGPAPPPTPKVEPVAKTKPADKDSTEKSSSAKDKPALKDSSATDKPVKAEPDMLAAAIVPTTPSKDEPTPPESNAAPAKPSGAVGSNQLAAANAKPRLVLPLAAAVPGSDASATTVLLYAAGAGLGLFFIFLAILRTNRRKASTSTHTDR